MPIASLPYIDEHSTVIAAGADDVWRSLGETLDRSFSGPGMASYARLVGSADCTASGPRPLAEGSTLPGFRVVTAVTGRELVLEGRHRFSSYALIFRLEDIIFRVDHGCAPKVELFFPVWPAVSTDG